MAAESRKSLLVVCYVLMASLFALSASFQFNDADWYFWIPLYTTACIVNLVMTWVNPNSRTKTIAKFALLLGLFLFIKVAVEHLLNRKTGFLSSLDMRERIVREQFGSGLVVISMFLVLENSCTPNHHPTFVTKYGMPILVGFAYGLSLFFFSFHQEEMRY